MRVTLIIGTEGDVVLCNIHCVHCVDIFMYLCLGLMMRRDSMRSCMRT